MKLVTGDLWAYDGRRGFVILITTNGYLKNDGEAVMGAGCAAQAKDVYPELPSLLGKSICLRGNVVSRLLPRLYSFPVKHNWWEKASLKLIRKSTESLYDLATKFPATKFVLPRPGCGNGRRTWKEIKPLLKDLPDNVFVIDRG